MALKLASTEFVDSPGTWRFHSAAPEPDLAAIVEEFWEVEGELAPFREQLLPNGFVELMINLGPVHRLITPIGVQTCERAWVSGLHERAITIESPSGTHLVSARLHAAHARRVIGGAMHRTANAVLDLESLIGDDAAALRRDLRVAASAAARMERLQNFVRARITATAPTDPRVADAANLIHRVHGMVRMGALAADLRVSRKHLAALFASHLGVSPKAYARICRFAWVLGRIRESDVVDWPGLAQAAGYADQSHLVRDFQRVAGASPTTFLRDRTPDGTALLIDAG